jgi:hypothetical protein
MFDDAKLSLHQPWEHLAKFLWRQIGEKPQAAKIDSQNWPLISAKLMARAENRPVPTEHQYEVRFNFVECECFGIDIRGDMHSRLHSQELDQLVASTLEPINVAANQHDQS